MLVVDIIKKSDDAFNMERLQELKDSINVQFRSLGILHRNNGQIRIAGDFRKKLTVQFECEKIPYDQRYGLVGGLDPLNLIPRQRLNKGKIVQLEVNRMISARFRSIIRKLVKIIVDQDRILHCRRFFFRY